MTEIRTLRPGLLVSLSTTIRGNVSYRTWDLENPHIDEYGEERARWETERVIVDPEEHEAAGKLRSKVRQMIVSVCSKSAFGLLCPEAKEPELRAAIAQARELVDKFNAEATISRMSVNVLYGRIAQDEVEAVKAISAELRGLMEDMQDGLKQLDVTKVREAAKKAREVGEMLSDEAKGRLEVAITAARSSARKIVKAGNIVGQEIDRAAIAQIDMARTSFLDLDEAGEMVAPTMEAPALDLTDQMYEDIQYGGRDIDPLFPEGNRPEGWDEITESAPGLGDEDEEA